MSLFRFALNFGFIIPLLRTRLNALISGDSNEEHISFDEGCSHELFGELKSSILAKPVLLCILVVTVPPGILKSSMRVEVLGLQNCNVELAISFL